MIAPQDLEHIKFSEEYVQEIIAKIDESIMRFHGWHSYEYAIVDSELPMRLRDYIAELYIKSGWTYVYHRTSSENGEKAGLTSFMFSTILLDDRCTKGRYMVSKVDDEFESTYIV